jgi:SOS-response transcriptional repressor LexA/DNA-binding XRE family transcriptional regulator
MTRKARSKATAKRIGDWASRVVSLRHKLNLSQSELGRRLSASAMAVSRWERGVQEPPASVYIQLGNLTGDPDCWYFWGRAGLHNEDFMRVLPSLRRRLKRERLPEVRMTDSSSAARQSDDLVVIPLLSERAAANQGSAPADAVDFHESATEAVLAVPPKWSPHPGQTSAFRVKGSSMEPLICDGYIVIVDATQSAPQKLYGEIVAAWHRDHGVILSRIHSVDRADVLIPDNREYKPIAICLPEWRILGNVIWWMCSPTQ